MEKTSCKQGPTISQTYKPTYSGRFAHINGYPSAASQVQAKESSPARDRRSSTDNHYSSSTSSNIIIITTKNCYIIKQRIP